MAKEILSVLVDNNSGVLARISSLFGRRGYNIDSLTVSTTDVPNLSRITLVVDGEKPVIDQIISQTLKLEEVQNIYQLDESRSVMRELLLTKLAADESNRGKIREIAEVYGASIVDLSPDSMILELTGKPAKIDGFVTMLKGFEIVEMCRTGITALERCQVRHPVHKVK